MVLLLTMKGRAPPCQFTTTRTPVARSWPTGRFHPTKSVGRVRRPADGPPIIHWCRAWKLQDADVLDVSQARPTKLSVRDRDGPRRSVHDERELHVAAHGPVAAAHGHAFLPG